MARSALLLFLGLAFTGLWRSVEFLSTVTKAEVFLSVFDRGFCLNLLCSGVVIDLSDV